MNRKDRRTQRAKERSAAYRRGLESAKTGKLDPGYVEEIEKLAELAARWVNEQPTTPDLKWLPQGEDGVMVIAELAAGAKHLADSPDAFRLIAWVDEMSGRRASLNQMVWALRRCRALPMPDGSYWGVTTTHESRARKEMLAIFDRLMRYDESDRMPGSPCGFCGKMLDASSGKDGGKPDPGDLSLCLYCAGVHQFTAELTLAPMSDAEIEALEQAGQIREHQAMLRDAIMRRGVRKGPVADA